MLIASLSLGSCASFQKSKAPENLPAVFQDSETDSDGEFRLPHETNPFRFIPKDAVKLVFKTYAPAFGNLKGVWYNPKYKSLEEYWDKWIELKGEVPREELFVYLDGDKILDTSISELQRLYSVYLERKKLERSGI
jgi:hypothetical protein